MAGDIVNEAMRGKRELKKIANIELEKMNQLVPIERIFDRIFLICDMKVMLDRDLAELYGVETRVLKQAVRRNIRRFPNDFMFEMTYHELKDLRSQFVTSSWGGVRYPPMAFTE